jgi:hypothetical protein
VKGAVWEDTPAMLHRTTRIRGTEARTTLHGSA